MESFLDKILVREKKLPRAEGRAWLILAPPGAGNNGDLAMVQAILENVDGPATLIVRNQNDYPVETLLSRSVSVVALSGLLYGTSLEHFRDVRLFGHLLSLTSEFAVVGADTMDGAYNERSSWRRSLLLRLAIRAGVNARVFGFSWNGNPKKHAQSMLKKASAEGAILHPRDPVSFRRLELAGFANLRQVTDVVFSSANIQQISSDELPAKFSLSRPFVIVNISGLIASHGVQPQEYFETIRMLIESGIQVLLLPHVIRDTSDDLKAGRVVAEALGDPSVHLVNQILSPPEIRSLAKHALAVITGRMHLAIISLSVCCPAIVMATQGKVEGLMELFGLPEHCVVPDPGFGRELCSVTRKVLNNHQPIVNQIGSHLPEVVQQSKLNYVGF